MCIVRTATINYSLVMNNVNSLLPTQGHFVTKIPEREVCYIKAFPIADVQSIGETKQNLKLIQV